MKKRELKDEINRLKSKVESLEKEVYNPTESKPKNKLLVCGVDLAIGKSETYVDIWEKLFKETSEKNPIMFEAMKDSYSHTIMLEMCKKKEPSQFDGLFKMLELQSENERLEKENKELKSHLLTRGCKYDVDLHDLKKENEKLKKYTKNGR